MGGFQEKIGKTFVWDGIRMILRPSDPIPQSPERIKPKIWIRREASFHHGFLCYEAEKAKEPHPKPPPDGRSNFMRGRPSESRAPSASQPKKVARIPEAVISSQPLEGEMMLCLTTDHLLAVPLLLTVSLLSVVY